MSWIQRIILISATINLGLACNRMPVSTNAGKSPADDRYLVTIGGNPQSFEPLQKYNITLMAVQGYSFIGFNLAIENEDSKYTNDNNKLGHWEIVDYSEMRFSERCANLMTHTNTLPKSRVQVIWTAPAPGAGCVSFKATVIEHRDVWYMDDGFLTKPFCEEVQDDIDNQPPVIDPCCACDEAKYELVFEGKWSRHTHPKDFPANNWKTHFSDVIGASHTVDYRFWQYGELASDGLREVAEHGSTRTLETELKEKSDEIRTIIKARGISFPNVTGKTFAVFRVDAKHHVISLVSMVNPSPDWIVGVSGLELCLPNCSWVEHKIHNLYPWDAGTDSGPSYMSADQPQVPPDVVRRIKSNFPNDPRSPFYDPNGNPMKPLARLHITRRRLYEKDCGSNENERVSMECATTNWSKWAPCDRKCGPGKRYRTREYKNALMADRFQCVVELQEEKDCVGKKCGEGESNYESNGFGGGRYDEASEPMNNPEPTPEIWNEPECALTDWVEDPCNTTCGNGFRIKTRKYLNKRGRKKCEVHQKQILQIEEECQGLECGGDIRFTDEGDDSDSRYRNQKFNRNHNRNKDKYGSSRHDHPLECVVQEWGPFSPCNSSCGSGFRVRTRTVWNNNLGYENSAHENDNYNDKCGRIPRTETLPCINEDCGATNPICYEIPKPGHCRSNIKSFWYYDYTSDQCGIFFAGDCYKNNNKFQSKELCESTCKQKPAFGELKVGSLRLEPVDCVVSEWKTGTCNATCGEGYQIRTRRVTRMPRHGGKPCPTAFYKIYKCWVSCNSPNGNNYYLRTKMLESQQPPRFEEEEECQYSNWTPWSPCTRTCGHNSMRQRTRYVLNIEMSSKCRDRVQSEKCKVPACSENYSCEGMFC